MKKLFTLMLALGMSAASFATPATDPTLDAHVSVLPDNRLHLFLGQVDATASVYLRDAAGNALYTTRVDLGETPFRQNFDISQLGEGTYQLVISSGKSTVTKTIVVATKPAEKVVAIEA